jgi:hypothetical protein
MPSFSRTHQGDMTSRGGVTGYGWKRKAAAACMCPAIYGRRNQILLGNRATSFIRSPTDLAADTRARRETTLYIISRTGCKLLFLCPPLGQRSGSRYRISVDGWMALFLGLLARSPNLQKDPSMDGCVVAVDSTGSVAPLFLSFWEDNPHLFGFYKRKFKLGDNIRTSRCEHLSE